MSFYSRLAGTTLKMLTKYGVSVTLRPYSVGASDYSPSTGVASPSGPDGSYDGVRKGLLTDQPGSQIQRKFGQTLQENSLVQSSEKWLYLDANGPAPRVQDHIVYDSVTYTIIDSQVTAPGGTPLFYLLVLKA